MTDSVDLKVFGKWILAGEHAVLRGSPALVFPVRSRSLNLHFREGESPLSVTFSGTFGSELNQLFWVVWRKSLDLLGQDASQVRGEIQIANDIPVGAGMGASACMSVAVSRWCVWRRWLSESEIHEFARKLENIFHGESSGVDIAVAMTGEPLWFQRGVGFKTIQPRWKPSWYLSYSGQKGLTEICVSRVKRLFEVNPSLAKRLDEQMRMSVEQANRVLSNESGSESLSKLAAAIQMAQECFSGWGLANGVLAHHMQYLSELGALAVKPTGSGDGGFVLSLWDQAPPASLMNQLIQV